MSKEIIWSSLAEKDLDSVLAYLNTEWNTIVVNKFLDLIDSNCVYISTFPKIYPEINKKKKIRKCVLTKHNSLYYRIKGNKIEILRIYDTRKDSKKLIF